MDIEGGEKKALKGCKNHIIDESPNLLISVYHNNSDIIEIPKMISGYNKNYKFYLRYYGGPLHATEIVLICIKNKKKKNIFLWNIKMNFVKNFYNGILITKW